MSSLVERLRATRIVQKGWGDKPTKIIRNPDGPEAANEIERLREVMRDAIDEIEVGAQLTAQDILREALSLHKDDRDGD